MNIESQVCLLEYAKRLAELGVKQDSCFYWSENNPILFAPNIFHENSVTLTKYYAAYTVAELGELLPDHIPNEGDLMCWNFIDNKGERTWGIEYMGSDFPHFTAENEANSRAKMLIWLIENGHVKV